MFKNIIFDLGGVLIDWNPRHFYRTVFNNDVAMEDFLENVCTDDWNIQQDCGNTLTDATNTLCKKFPEKEALIRMYYAEWPKMLAGSIKESVAILKQLKQNNLKLFALTNWSHETFPYARKTFNFLGDFIDIVVSGEEKIMKPDHRIYKILLSRNNLQAHESVFIDDNIRNVKAAQELGIHGINFTSPQQLKLVLHQLQLLP